MKGGIESGTQVVYIPQEHWHVILTRAEGFTRNLQQDKTHQFIHQDMLYKHKLVWIKHQKIKFVME